MYLTRSFKMLAVLSVLCLAANVSTAQLEFSNWIVGKNSVLHIEPDGRASIVQADNIADDDYLLLSDHDGKVIITVGFSPLHFKDVNNKTLFSDNDKRYPSMPFMFQSPDSEYIYILHNTYSYEFTDIITCKTQFRCLCKKISDDTDEVQDIILHEEISQTDSQFYQRVYVERPFSFVQSCSDGKSVWVVMKGMDDRFIVAKLRGHDIVEIKELHYPLYYGDTFWVSGTRACNFVTADNGKVFCDISDDSQHILCLYFNQTDGVIQDHKVLDVHQVTTCNEVSSNGTYLYYSKGRIKEQDRFIYRQKISDMEKGIYNEEIVSSEVFPYSSNRTNFRIGPDGNIYIFSGKSSISVIYDSESDNPRVENLFTDIPDANICFPNYLRTNDNFFFTVDCDKTVSLHYYDTKNEVEYHHWDFGDGNSSGEAAPQHYYAKTGVYDVTLKLFLKNGKQKILPSRKITIKELGKPTIIPE